MKKAPQILSPARAKQRKPPSNAFKPGNEFAFRPGQSGNSGGMGRPRDPLRLVSRAMRHQLNTKAPHYIAESVDLEPGASWAQCVAAALLRMSVMVGEPVAIAAAREIRELTEGGKVRLEMTGEDGEALRPPSINIIVMPRDARLQKQ